MVIGLDALLEGHQVLVVQAVGAFAADHGRIALVQLDLYVSCYILLRLVNECGQSFTRGSKPLTEVHKIGEFSRKHLFQMCRFTVESYCFKHFVRGRSTVEEIEELVHTLQVSVLVIGLRRRTAVGKLLLGSTAQEILMTVSCPVLCVKAA